MPADTAFGLAGTVFRLVDRGCVAAGKLSVDDLPIHGRMAG
ncbi:hypothetical protein [Nocardia miyunensis]|nr:hypothetical protein [Nocardia miyunensis]